MGAVKTAIQREVKLGVTPEQAFALITEPEHITRWFCDEIDPLDRGFRFSWRMQDGGNIGFEVKIIEYLPEERFVYRSVDQYPTETSFELAPGEDGTHLNVVERFHPDTPDLDALYNEHSGGWDWFLSRLQSLVT